MAKVYIGVDPGRRGAIAIIKDKTVYIYDLPYDMQGYKDMLINCSLHIEDTDEVFGAIEDVWGVRGSSMRSVTTFMKFAGCAELFLRLLCNSDIHFVTPTEWKGHFGIKAPKTSKTMKKKLDVSAAHKLYPRLAKELPVSKDGRSDALLIARWLKDKMNQS